jgi:hypothetical protein
MKVAVSYKDNNVPEGQIVFYHPHDETRNVMYGCSNPKETATILLIQEINISKSFYEELYLSFLSKLKIQLTDKQIWTEIESLLYQTDYFQDGSKVKNRNGQLVKIV